ncbi:MAG: glycosyltransferase [candidate division FCPU426 bacterium]
MKIAYFTDTFLPQVNGLVTSILTSREALKKKGHEVLVFGPSLPLQVPETGVYRLGGFTYYPQPEYTFVLPWGKGFALRHFDRFKADLIHCHGVWGAWIAAWLVSRRFRKPVVLTYHTFFELYLHYFPLPSGFLRKANAFFTRGICDRCDLVIAPTQIIRDALIGYGTKTPVVVLPTGLSADVFKKTGASKKDFGVPAKALMISSAGRLGKEKNFEVLLRAIAAIKQALGDFRLVIAGDGPERVALEKLAAELGFGKNLVLLGYVSRTKVLDLMEASDLFAFPSVTETQGMVILEAMGRGTPVIAANALGPSEILKSGKGGWLAKADDAEDLSLQIRQALNAASRAKKAKEAVVLAKTFAAEAINEKLAKLYAQVLRAQSNRIA